VDRRFLAEYLSAEIRDLNGEFGEPARLMHGSGCHQSYRAWGAALSLLFAAELP
jgi:hypothetical protein